MEIWKTTPINKDYEVSNYGKVRSKDRTIKCADGRVRSIKGKTIKGKVNKGYYVVSLGRKASISIHRLVALSFLENPNNYQCINHIDGNKQNNNACNLEWCNYSQNLIHAYKNNLNPIPKKVRQIALDGTIIKDWESASQCEKELGFDHRKISKCCNNKANTHRGYRWCFI